MPFAVVFWNSLQSDLGPYCLYAKLKLILYESKKLQQMTLVDEISAVFLTLQVLNKYKNNHQTQIKQA